jgi:hypothetical protein
MFTSLTEKFERVFAAIRSRGKLSENDVRETVREVRRALLEADVNFHVVKDFVTRVEARLVGDEVHKSFTPEQQIIRVVNEEMTQLLGGTAVPFHLKQPTSVVMVVGLQGSGKTTFSAKLAAMLRKRGRKPLLVGLDVYRPAAMDQLEILGRQIAVPVSRASAGETDVLALLDRADDWDALVARLGKYKTGKSCLYIKRLADIDIGVLEELIAAKPLLKLLTGNEVVFAAIHLLAARCPRRIRDGEQKAWVPGQEPPDQGGFPGSGRAHRGNHFPLFDPKRYVSQCVNRAFAFVALGDILHLDHRHSFR